MNKPKELRVFRDPLVFLYCGPVFLRILGLWVKRRICSDVRRVYSEFGKSIFSCLSWIMSAKNFVYHLISSLLCCRIVFRLLFWEILPDILILPPWGQDIQSGCSHIATVRIPSPLPREDRRENEGHHEEEDIALVPTNKVEPILECHISSHCKRTHGEFGYKVWLHSRGEFTVSQ